MLVTYVGNSVFTWRMEVRRSVGQVMLFVVINMVGLGFSILTLWISHDLLGMTTRLDDNVSANGIGLALGAAFRYWLYRKPHSQMSGYGLVVRRHPESGGYQRWRTLSSTSTPAATAMSKRGP